LGPLTQHDIVQQTVNLNPYSTKTPDHMIVKIGRLVTWVTRAWLAKRQRRKKVCSVRRQGTVLSQSTHIVRSISKCSLLIGKDSS